MKVKFFKFLTKIALSFVTLLHSAYGMSKEDLSKIYIKADLRLSSYPYMLLGENVWLRPSFPQDAPAFFPILMNSDKMKYLGTGRACSTEECYALILRRAHDNLSVSYVPEDLLNKNSAVFSWSFFNHKGPSGIVRISKAQDLGYEDYLEIAYYGQGGTGEAVKTVLANLKEFPFVATVHPQNKASIKILTENSFELERENIPKYGSVRNYYGRSTQSTRNNKFTNQLLDFLDR